VHNPDIQAGLSFYDTPAKAGDMPKIKAPIFGLHAENVARINKDLPAATDAMKAAGKFYEPIACAGAGLAHALGRRQQTVDHVDGYIEYLGAETGRVDPVLLAEIVRRTREAGTAVVPTMVLWETIIVTAELSAMMIYPELRYMPAKGVERWQGVFTRRTANEKFDRALCAPHRRQPQDRAQGLRRRRSHDPLRHGFAAGVQRARLFRRARDAGQRRRRAHALPSPELRHQGHRRVYESQG